jgi:hypothetical protein
VSSFRDGLPLAAYEPKIELVPHPLAPHFAQPDRDKVLEELLVALASSEGLSHPETVLLLREASLVSLFFFLKLVASHSGPYDKLSWDLHVDLCNFRQTALAEGSKCAAFLPRSSFKSTIMTHGGAAWELLRNPDLRIGIFSSKYERAAEFMHTTQRIFDDNAAVRELFPEYTPSGAYGSRWNDREAVLPNRSKTYPEPNLKAHSAGGSTAGVHVDLAVFDDIIDDSQLNADHGATADLYRMRNWLFTNMRTLLVSQKSRTILSATRYALDDPYEDIMLDAHKQAGYWGELSTAYPKRAEGEWDVYYRRAIEQDQSIFPAAYTVESLTRLASSDPWTYQTQYLNDPKAASVLEFLSYKVREASIDFDAGLGDFVVELSLGREVEKIRLGDCDVVVGVDPAASSKYVSQRTSRTAYVLMLRDYKDRYIFIEARRGYWAPSEYIDRIFELCKKYNYAQRAVAVEMQAGFKVLEDVFRQEQHRRNVFLNVRSISALAKKEDTIRNVWQPVLNDGRVFAVTDNCLELLSEVSLFPSSPAKDLLDAGKIAISFSRLPEAPLDADNFTDEELAEALRKRHRSLVRRNCDPITGY